MGANDSAIKGIADAAAGLYSSVAPMAIQNALQAGRPETLATLYGMQGGALGQLGGLLGQQGNLIGQQGLGPWNIVQGLGGLLNQRKSIDLAKNAAQGK